MKYRLSRIRVFILWLVSRIWLNRVAPIEKREEEIFYKDYGGGLYYIPYAGKTFLAVVRNFCRRHPDHELLCIEEHYEFLGMKRGVLVSCKTKEEKIKEPA